MYWEGRYTSRYTMKQWFLISCLLLLASCMDVDTFGEYWDKGTIDPYIIGKWDLARDRNKVSIVVSSDNAMYHITYNSQEKYIAKTLKVGHYTFFMAKETKYRSKISGVIVRYAINDGKVTLYEFDFAALNAFLKTRYPTQQVIYNTPEGGGSMTVKVLNEETIQILSEIPDTEQYWRKSDEYIPIS